MMPPATPMRFRILALIALAGCTQRGVAPVPSRDALVPRIDYHVHLRSADDSAYLGDGSPPRTVTDLVSALDRAGIQRALVASTAYFFGAPDVRPDGTHDEYARVRAENDWVAAQIKEYPARLVGFCSVNPLRDYAVREIARCRDIGLHGLKLHLANSRVDLGDTSDVRKLHSVFAAANAARLPLLVHLRSRKAPFGARDAHIFIKDVLSAAPDVPVQIAHLAGWGSYDQGNDEALGECIRAMSSGEVDRTRLYFDLAAVYFGRWNGIAVDPMVTEWTPVIARRLREIGLDHVLFGTDWPGAGCCASQHLTADFLVNDAGLTREEVRKVFANVAPYMR